MFDNTYNIVYYICVKKCLGIVPLIVTDDENMRCVVFMREGRVPSDD